VICIVCLHTEKVVQSKRELKEMVLAPIGVSSIFPINRITFVAQSKIVERGMCATATIPMTSWVQQLNQPSGSNMGLRRWFHQNIADTDGSTHADLKPLELPLGPREAFERMPSVIANIRGWKVESLDSESGVIKVTRRTRGFGFIDDIVLKIQGTRMGIRIHVRSESRVGKGDLGQNRRNILELFRTLRKQMGRS